MFQVHNRLHSILIPYLISFLDALPTQAENQVYRGGGGSYPDGVSRMHRERGSHNASRAGRLQDRQHEGPFWGGDSPADQKGL